MPSFIATANSLSDTFAASVYRLLLKAYVGSHDIEQALATMEKLEVLSQQKDQTSTISIYVQLGKELEREFNELEAAGEQQKTAETRRNFEQFLEGLYNREEGQSFFTFLDRGNLCQPREQLTQQKF
ncbi:MAG: hypothetical protein R3C11_12575 [Planctomycetaceae bacterium]